jgi:hypothetical protein
MAYLQTVLSVFLLLCVLLAAATAVAMVSVNVPIGHWSYDVIDKLVGMGLIQSDLRGTRPITRLEMARLTREAEEAFQEAYESEKEKYPATRWEIIRALIDRLKNEFRASLEDLSAGGGPNVAIKPIEDVYLSYRYGSNEFDLENDKGQKYGEGSNVRAGFSTHGAFLNHLAYYVNPEYRYTQDLSPKGEACCGSEGSELELLEGYGKLEFFNFEVEVGRDSLWWGPGRHGSLILSTNAKPFDMLKFSNPRPVVLPWIFKYLGLFKFEAFYTKLEEARVIPEPEFMGYRFNIKPFPFLELAHSRTIMLCGDGSGVKCVTDLSFSDWIDVLFGGEDVGGDLNTNQILGFDIDLNIQNVDRWVPGISSVNIWFEYADESGPAPPNSGFVTGIKLGDILLNGKTDFIFEYADNVIRLDVGDLVFYAHGKYRTGYRYFCDVMGHTMDADAREYYVRLQHFLTPDWVLGLAYNYQDRGIEAAKEGDNLDRFLERNGMDRANLEDKQRVDLDLTYQKTDRFLAQAGYRYEKIDDVRGVSGATQDNHTFWAFLQYSF